MAKLLHVATAETGDAHQVLVSDDFEIPKPHPDGWFVFKGESHDLAVHSRIVTYISLKPSA